MKVWCLLCVFLGSLALPSAARPGPLVVILLPGTSLRDWQNADAPNLHRLMATGALAVMNTRTARLPNDHTQETPESAVLTLGAGARAVGGPEATAFLGPQSLVSGIGVTAGTLYARRVGHAAPLETAVNLSWPVLLQANEGLDYDIRLGNLADTLAAAGIIIRAGGGRFSDPAAVSGDGTVHLITSLVVRPSECLIWDAGSNLPVADALIGQAATEVTAQKGRLIVLSPFASDEDYAHGRRLTPVLEWGSDVPGGLLSSSSTRRPGLVTNTDFAPTIAAYFGQTTMATRPFGQAWAAQPAANAVKQTRALEEQAYRQAQGMKALPYLAVGLAVWVLVGTALALKGKVPPIWPLVPPALLLALLFSGTAAIVPILVAVFLLPTWALQRRFSTQSEVQAWVAFLVLTLVLDMVTGNHLMKRSLLGYSAVEGARYYGIGNEAMGVLIGSLLVLTARLWRSVHTVQTAIVFLLLCVVFLFGAVGAKAGGVLVSLAAFGTLLYGLWGRRWSVRAALSLLGLTALVMALIALGDAFLPGSRHSHIGEAVSRIQSGGWAEARDIVWRKLAVESRLASHSAWACLLWTGLFCLPALWRQSETRLRREPLHAAGLVAVAACLLLNDAGVVAAALCLVLLWSDAVAQVLMEKPLEKDASPGAHPLSRKLNPY